MLRINKEKIGGNIPSCDDADDTCIKEEEDFGPPCNGDECQLPDWDNDE